MSDTTSADGRGRAEGEGNGYILEQSEAEASEAVLIMPQAVSAYAVRA